MVVLARVSRGGGQPKRLPSSVATGEADGSGSAPDGASAGSLEASDGGSVASAAGGSVASSAGVAVEDGKSGLVVDL